MKRITILTSLFLIINICYGQYETKGYSGDNKGTYGDSAEIINLNTPLNGNNTYNYLASKYITLFGQQDDDFEYTAASGDSLTAEVDPLMIFPPEEDTTIGPPNNNNGGVVGTIPGKFSVTPTGSANYNIPLSFPEGTNGMTPSLSINYSSRGGEGQLGEKFQLNGISVINRFPYSYYFNDSSKNITFNLNDQLLLDGQHLIKIGENEYRTEIDNFTKIVPINGNINEGFIVYRKDGSILKYGTSLNSRQTLQSCSSPIAWYIDTIFDNYNNYISYEYYNYATYGFICPHFIKYTGNSNVGSTPYYRIEFIYENNNDTPKLFFYNQGISGDKLFTKVIKRLKEIRCRYLPTWEIINNYKLHYKQKGIFNKYYLSDITQFGEDDKFYNPTIFQWDTSNYNPSHYKEGELGEDFKESSSFYFSDFNMDGKDDLIHFTSNSNSKVFIIHMNQGNGKFNYGYDFYHSFNTIDVQSFQVGDFNGDGINDILYSYIQQGKFCGKIIFINYDESSNSLSMTEDPNTYFYLPTNQYFNNRIIISDFTGNGLMDCCLLSDELGGNSKISIYKSEIDSPLSEKVYYNTLLFIPDNYLVDDFDGDNKYELLLMFSTSSKIYELTGSNNTIVMHSVTNFSNNNGKIFSGDFNKDSKADILILDYDTLRLYYSYGYGFNEASIQILNNIPSGYNVPSVLDLNGDGLCDLSILKFDPDQYKYFKYDYLTKPNGTLTLQSSKFIFNCSKISSYNDLRYAWGEIYNSGMIDLFALDIKLTNIYVTKKYHTICDTINNSFNVVSEITNGFGKKISINYSPIDYCEEFSLGNDEPYPICQIYRTLPVTTWYKEESGAGTQTYSYSFQYKGAKYHRFGKGFLGFDEFTMINQEKGIKTTTYKSHNNAYYFQQTDSIKQWIIGSNTLIGRKIFSNNYKSFGGKRFFHYVSETKSKRFDLNEELIDYTYNNSIYYFNENNIPIQFVHNTKKKIGDEWFNNQKKISYLNYTVNNNWIVGLQDTIKTVISSNNEDSETDLTVISYKAQRPWSPLYKKNKPNDEQSFETKVTFDSFDEYGNLLQKTLQAEYPKYGDEPALVIQYEYKTENNYQARFLTKVIFVRDGVSYEECYDYEKKMGLKIKFIDINNLIYYYYYDNFGRLVKTVNPDGTMNINILRWSNNHPDNPPFGVFYLWKGSSGSAPTITFFDKAGRDLRDVSRGFSGQKIYTKKSYYSNGLIEKIYEPYFKNEGEGNFTKYEYDDLLRVITEILPTHTEKLTYNGLSVNSKNLTTNVETTKTLNTIGKVKSISDPSGTIDYEYYSSGKIKNISSTNGITSFLYDAAGNIQSLSESNSGTTTFDYDSYSRLRMKSDSKGNVSNIDYDELNRILNYYITAGTGNNADDINLIYSYITDNTINGFGQLESITNQNNISYHYYYDTLGRLIKNEETIDGHTYSNNYNYDIFGRNKSLTYTTGYKTINYFNEWGYRGKIKRAGDYSILQEIKGMNQRGQITEFTLGNGLTTTNTYNNFGFYETINTSNGLIQDLSYDFEPATGNLNWREDNTGTLSLHENFNYDYSLHNRLTDWGEDNQIQMYSIFSANGNVLCKTDITNYTPNCYQYSSSKPNAVTQIQSLKSEYMNYLQGKDQNIEYNSFNKIKSIVQSDKKLEFVYGPDGKRKKMSYFELNAGLWELKKTKYYILGNYEIEENIQNNTTRELLYIEGFAIKEYKSSGEEKLYYLYGDYQGNLQTVTDENGNIVKRYAFDPWGRRRNPDTWKNLTYDEIMTEDFLFTHGYTGHEHLDAFGLINMNGRVYDPYIGRFLSPDPIVQQPYNMQNLNRYSYAINNPLKYTDPSGYTFSHDQLDDAHQGGGTWVNTEYIQSFYNIQRDFDVGYEAMPGIYEYNYSTGDYTNSMGHRVSYQEVFNNYVVPNATFLPTNTNLSSIEFGTRNGESGVWFSTITWGPIKRMDSEDFIVSTEAQILSSFLSFGSAGGGDDLTLSETGTMATVIGLTNTFTRGLIDWGVRQATTPWGKSISRFNKFSKGTGKFLGYYSGLVYGMQVGAAYNSGDRLHTLSNGLMSFYSIVATQGDGAGFAITLPFFVIDWTVGMDNFLLYNFNYGIEQSNQIGNGNWGVSLWRPGQGLR